MSRSNRAPMHVVDPTDGVVSEQTLMPIARPRLVARLENATARPVTILAAAAGFGKTTALGQFLQSSTRRWIRFDLAALLEACARARVSARRGVEPARSSLGELEAFEGLVIIDDLHVALGDPRIGQFIGSLVQASKTRTHWILATRSTAGLPLATWLAYGDADFVIDERDLEFSVDEVRRAFTASGFPVDEQASNALQQLTHGWPVGVGFALRAALRLPDPGAHATATREMMYAFLAEQVYDALEEEDRRLLEVAAALPSVDVSVLELGGFDGALRIIEGVRARTSLIREETSGVYRCHEIFAQFLSRQVALAGPARRTEIQSRAARALERSGDVEHALDAWAAAGSKVDVLRLLERWGFELVERARYDAVRTSLEGLDEKVRRENPRILALRGLLHAAGGRPVRADGLLRRAMQRAAHAGDRDLFATISLKLALLVANRRGDAASLLKEVAEDDEQQTDFRAEAFSLLAADRAIAADAAASQAAIARVRQLLPLIEIDATRARVLQRLGVAQLYTSETESARESLAQAAELATELHLYSIASRAYANLCNLMLHGYDDVTWQLRYAERAAFAAKKAENKFDMQTALLQVLSGEMRSGNEEKSVEVERQLEALNGGDADRDHLVLACRALRMAWAGKFGDAHRILSSCWKRMGHAIDQLFCGAQCALYLAMDQRREESIAICQAITAKSPLETMDGLSHVRYVAIARMLCAIAERTNGRKTHAERMARSISAISRDPLVVRVRHLARRMLVHMRGESCDEETLCEEAESLTSLGYGGLARLLVAVINRIGADKPAGGAKLTAAEQSVLVLLADGWRTKEIASHRSCSIYTVRAHVANIIAKLGCRGRAEAVAIARRMHAIS